ncbi:MAG: hypothetical protein ACRCX8_03525, partial [Sarcina sp.]
EGRPALEHIKYNLFGFLSLDIDILREKLFYKLYSDMFELIENILNLDCYTTEYTKKLTDIALEFTFNTILIDPHMNPVSRHNRIELLTGLSLVDIGDDTASFLMPTGNIEIADYGVVVKYICEIKYIDKVKFLFKDSCFEVIEENDTHVLFDVFLQDVQHIEIMVNEARQANHIISIEKELGLTDSDYIIWHLIIAVLNKLDNRTSYLCDLKELRLENYYNLGIIKQNIKEER